MKDVASPPFSEVSPHYNKALEIFNFIGLRHLSDDEALKISERYRQHLLSGLSHTQESSLQMIDTHFSPIDISSLPTGKKVLVVEIGGTNVYGGVVEKTQAGSLEFIKQEDGSTAQHTEPLKTRKYASTKDFFDAIINPLTPLIETTGTPDALAIVYSFPATAITTKNGVDVLSPRKLPKEFVIKGISREPVGQAFLRELGKRFGFSDMPIVVLNDTPAVLLAGEAKIGGVVGTGYNLALAHQGVIYNTESGGFSALPMHVIANRVDVKSDAPGKQKAEKQISGMYLAGQVKETLSLLREHEVLGIKPTNTLSSEVISNLLKLNRDKLPESIRGTFDTETLAILSAAAGRMRYRSAQLVGIMIGTMIKTFEKEFENDTVIKVPIQGSLFWKTPEYKLVAKDWAEKIAWRNVEFLEIKQAGIKGAAAAALSLL